VAAIKVPTLVPWHVAISRKPSWKFKRHVYQKYTIQFVHHRKHTPSIAVMIFYTVVPHYLYTKLSLFW